jgi:ubiquinone/menaquinone biosynthesis C-methylase UbiE
MIRTREELDNRSVGREKAKAASKTAPPNMAEYLQQWEAFFDQYASYIDYWHRRNAGYHRAIAQIARYYIPQGSTVLEVGWGNGDLLAAVDPSKGLGVDISRQMISVAAEKYPHLEFHHTSAEHLEVGAPSVLRDTGQRSRQIHKRFKVGL